MREKCDICEEIHPLPDTRTSEQCLLKANDRLHKELLVALRVVEAAREMVHCPLDVNYSTLSRAIEEWDKVCGKPNLRSV